MKKFSIVILVLLASCTSLVRHKDDFKPAAHDMIDEAIDGVAIPKAESKIDPNAKK